MIWRSATIEDIVHVCRNLRPEDAEEQFARRDDSDPDHLAADLIGLWRLVITRVAICGRAGPAQAIVAAYRTGPSVAGVHRMQTTSSVDVTRAVFLYGARTMPRLLGAVVQRAECSLMTKHTVMAGLFERMGYHAEGIEARKGRNGEAFMKFGWRNPQAAAHV